MGDRLLRVGFCVSGGGRLFQSAVMHAAQLGIQPTLLIAEAKASTGLEDFSRAHGMQFVRLPKMPRQQFDEELFTHCAGADLDLLSLTFDKLIPASLVQHYRGKIINVHPALLPAFKGMRALEQVAESGALFAGATIHEVDEQMDHGPIIAQCILGLQPNESAEAIGGRVFPLLRLMYLQVLAWYAEGRVTKDAQGRIFIRDAVYGQLPILPALERSLNSE